MKVAAAALLLATTASADPAPRTFDMVGFFTGKTHADNVIKAGMGHPHKLIVDSIGGHNKEGEFILIDQVREEGKPDRKRTWAMKEVGPNHFSGTLSDAIGPVDVVVNGSGATIRYTMRDGGVKIVQQVQLQADGRTLSNHVDARKFGLKFGNVDGTIRKLD
jgi:hypothetical protein